MARSARDVKAPERELEMDTRCALMRGGQGVELSEKWTDRWTEMDGRETT